PGAHQLGRTEPGTAAGADLPADGGRCDAPRRRRVHCARERLDGEEPRRRCAGAGGESAELCRRTQSLWAAGVLRDPCLGVGAEPAGKLRRLEYARHLRPPAARLKRPRRGPRARLWRPTSRPPPSRLIHHRGSGEVAAEAGLPDLTIPSPKAAATGAVRVGTSSFARTEDASCSTVLAETSISSA